MNCEITRNSRINVKRPSVLFGCIFVLTLVTLIYSRSSHPLETVTSIPENILKAQSVSVSVKNHYQYQPDLPVTGFVDKIEKLSGNRLQIMGWVETSELNHIVILSDLDVVNISSIGYERGDLGIVEERTAFAVLLEFKEDLSISSERKKQICLMTKSEKEMSIQVTEGATPNCFFIEGLK
jgi:hypothetical protein